MKTHDDDVSSLFKTIGSKNSPFIEFGEQANATNAQERWPLFKTITLEKRPPPPQLLQDEKAQWEKPAVPVAPLTQPTPPASKSTSTSTSLASKIAGGLNKLTRARNLPPLAPSTMHHTEPQAVPPPNVNVKPRVPLLPTKSAGDPSWLGKLPKSDTPTPDAGSKLFGRLAKTATTEAAPKPVRSSRLFNHSADSSPTRSTSVASPILTPHAAPHAAPPPATRKSLFGGSAATPQQENTPENKQESKPLASLFARIQTPEQAPEPAPATVRKRSFFNRLGKF